MERLNSCVSCNRSVLRRRKHFLTQIFLEQHRDHAVLLLQEIVPREIPFDGTRSICHACWMRYDRLWHNQQILDQQDLQRQDQPPQQVRQEDEEIEVVGFGRDLIAVNGYLRVSNTRRRCVFKNCRNVTAHNVPTYAKFQLLNNSNFYIPEFARVCNPHLVENNWNDLVNGPRVHENFNGAHVLDMLNIMKWGYEHKGLHFENMQQIDDNELL